MSQVAQSTVLWYLPELVRYPTHLDALFDIALYCTVLGMHWNRKSCSAGTAPPPTLCNAMLFYAILCCAMQPCPMP